MIETFTKNDVVKYVYNETNQEEKENIEIAKLIFSELDEEIDDMLLTKEFLNNHALEPSKRTLDNIMAFAISQSKAVA